MKPCIRIEPCAVLLVIFLGCAPSSGQRISKEQQPSLAGEWVVTRQSVPQLAILPRCRSIQPGTTTFTFSRDTLKVYTEKASSPCDVFGFRRADSTITFIKADMHFLSTYALRADTLTIKSRYFFTPVETDTAVSGNPSPARAQDVVLTLKKK